MRNKDVVRNVTQLIGTLRRKNPFFFWSTIIVYALIGGVSTYVNVYLLMKVLLTIERKEAFSSLVYLIILVVFVEISLKLIESYYLNRMHPVQSLKLKQTINNEIIEKASTIDYKCYDDSKFYDDIMLSLEKSDESLTNSLDIIGVYAKGIVGIVAVIPLFDEISPFLLLFVLLSVVTGIIVQKKLNKCYYERYLSMVPYIKRNSYIMTRFAFWEYSEELRINNFPSVLIKHFKNTYQNMNKVIKQHGRKIILYSICKGLVSYIVIELIVVGYLSYNLFVTKTLSAAVFMVALAAVLNVKDYLNNMAENYEKLMENSLYVSKIQSFMNYENTVVGGDIHPQEGVYDIEFKHVYFKYPFSENYVLKDFSLHIRKGEKAAIVGLNGAGKTTIVNLLLRLYDIQEGVIEVNGVDIKQYDLDEYRRSFGVVFQDFNLYSVSLEENIELGQSEDTQTIENALKKLEFDLEKIGLDSEISSEFDDDGIKLSGGESQKIAIARALVNDRGTNILDEPSSSLDPFMESKMNSILCKEMEGKTIVFISHRLTTTTLADRIFYIENGSVIESGSHKELMNKHGMYEKMYNIQASKYIKKECCQE
ncbi:MAG: ABC transporter ATP-binding protein [Clostridiales bacterium]|nr:ABC transporter ATP-binding protein [Clostridiales bacterium]